MTCREKLREMYPDYESLLKLLTEHICPDEFGILDDPEFCLQSDDSCTRCWDREIPGTLPMQYPIDTAAEAELAKGEEAQWTKKNPFLSGAVKEANEEFRKVEDAVQKLAKPDDRVTVTRKANGGISATIEPYIKDSGDRTEFATGAVRDMREGKGRCDLMPLEVVAKLMCIHNDTTKPDLVTGSIALFKNDGYQNTIHLYNALLYFSERYYNGHADMFLEVAKHFEEGARKYGENNWQKGIPVHCYIDSAVRHYLKWLRGDKDEPHDRAFVWNLMCCIWEVDYHSKREEEAE